MSRSAAVGTARQRVDLVVRLQLRDPSRVVLERVPQALAGADMAWLGEEVDDPREGQRSYLCDLELRAAGQGPTIFSKAAIVSLGTPVRTPTGWVVPVEWRAASLSALFPVFAGYLVFDEDGIELDGGYAPPGGRLGYLLDVTLMGMAARQTARWFMRHVAAALGSQGRTSASG